MEIGIEYQQLWIWAEYILGRILVLSKLIARTEKDKMKFDNKKQSE